jgi:hypothetical protein
MPLFSAAYVRKWAFRVQAVPGEDAVGDEGAQRADRASQRNPKQPEKARCTGSGAQRPDKERKCRTASACARQCAKDHCRIERHNAPPEPPEMNAQPRGAIPLTGRRQQFRRMRDMTGDIGEPGVEQIEQHANRRQQEYRR